MRRLRPKADWLRFTLAGAVIFCLFAASLMAVSPALHGHFHQSGLGHHSCLATTLAHGGCEGIHTAPLAVVAALTHARYVHGFRATWVRAGFLKNGVLVHGPPALA